MQCWHGKNYYNNILVCWNIISINVERDICVCVCVWRRYEQQTTVG